MYNARSSAGNDQIQERDLLIVIQPSALTFSLPEANEIIFNFQSQFSLSASYF